MKYKAKKKLFSDELGVIEKGAEFEATEAQISGLAGFVEKLTEKEPKKDDKKAK